MDSSRSALVALFAFALLLASAGELRAEDPDQETSEDHPHVIVGYQPSWFLMGGATGGASFGPAGPGGFVGGEVSLFQTIRGFWTGLYVDGAYDFRSRAPTASLGPEVGYEFVGLDVGGAARFESAGVRPGVMSRLSLNAAVASLYGRYIYWPIGETYSVQVGATLKLPLVSPWGEGATRGETPPWSERSD